MYEHFGRHSRRLLQTIAVACLLQPAVKADLFAIDSALDQLYKVNTTDATVTLVGSTSPIGTPAALAFDGSNMYTIDLQTGALYTLDLVTGAPSLVGTSGIFGWQALAARPSDGALFAQDQTRNFYSINKANGVATFIGTTNVGFSLTALDFDAQGRLWGVDFVSGNYGTVDLSTGQFTSVGSTVARVQGLAFAPSGLAYISETSEHKLYTLDVSTGVTTLVGSLGLPFVKGLEFDTQAAPVNVPEPHEVVLLGSAIVAAASLGLRRRSAAHTN
ncbi:hypothetical protein F183_A34960 [Bryobacterales bacterium F-183]|nr:hypothetical protein F183_A34960 [Bryobacterales bacterium F-183]